MQTLKIGQRVDENGNPIEDAPLTVGAKVDENGKPLATPPASTNNALQDFLDKAGAIVGQSGQMPLGTGKLAQGMINTLTHPLDNAPTIGGMAAGAAATALAPELTIPALLMRVGAAGAGGMGGSAVRGDKPADIPLEGAKQAAYQAVGGELPFAAAQKIVKPLAQTFGYHALSPAIDDLAAMRDASGKTFEVPGRAAQAMKQQVLDVSGERPGSNKYAEDLLNQIKTLRAQKEAILAASEGSIPKGMATEGPGLEHVVTEATNSAAPRPALKTINQTVRRFQNRPELNVDAEGITPRNAMGVPTTRPTDNTIDWTPEQVDALLQGIDKDVNRQTSARYVAQQSGQRPAPDFDTQTLQSIRGNLKDALTSAEPGIAPLNQRMTDLIPIKNAALPATVPGASGIPRVRVASSGNPLQIFDYLSKQATGHLAQPMYRAANATGPNASVLARLAAMLASQESQ